MIIDQKSLLTLQKVFDFFFLNVSFILAAIFAQPIEELYSNQLLFILLLLQNILWFVVANIVNAYPEFSNRSFSDQLMILARILTVQVLFTIMFLFFVKENLFTRNFVLFYGLILLTLIYLKEYILWKIIDKQRSRGKNLRNLLIVGLNDLSKEFKEEITLRPEFGFRFMGFIDDSDIYSDECLGSLNELDKILTERNINDVLYASSLDDTDYLTKIQRLCDKNAVKLTLLPQIKALSNSNLEINFLGNFPVLNFRHNRLEQFQWRAIKRLFDITFCLFALITILWFVYLIIAVIIKTTSKGKVLFNQNRIGKNGKIFLCYKFRSMRGANHNQKNVVDDSERITPIGKFLRKYSLDELPQFINVLKGDMSIVGPRPHAINYNAVYSEMVEEIKLRHRVKPGITGWAQVHGLRGDVFDFEENKIRTKKRINFDNWYIENWSLKLDVQIIIETVWQIISGRNLGT